MANPYMTYADPAAAVSKKPEDETDQFGGAQGFVAPAPAAPTEPSPAAPATQETETDSVVTTKTAPRTHQVVASKETVAAAKEVQAADAATRTATEAKMAADAKLEQTALEAERKRVQKEREDAAAELAARKALEQRQREQQAAADAAEAKADADVKKAQDAAINWDDRSTGFKILQAFVRAGSVRDSYILKDGDPMNNPVIRTLDSALAEEKEKKQRKFLASKEFKETLKTHNAEAIKRAYAQGLADIDLQTTANAKNLLLSEKTDSLMSKVNKADPGGAAWKANRDIALAELDRRNAEAKMKYAQHYDPTKESGGSTTVTTKKSVTKEGAGAGGDVVDMRTVYNADGSVRGLAPGTAKVSHDGVKAREMFAQLKPVREGLLALKDSVGKTDAWDRVPIAGGFSDNQKRIKGQLENMLAPITQLLGSGTPQEGEAKRRLATLTVGMSQGKEVSQANIDALIKYIDDAYDAKISSVVPVNKATNAGAKPAEPGVLTKVEQGFTFTSKDGGKTWE